ncbi:MAG: hypothetical protein AAB368_12675, partial [bacterium]
MKGALLLCWCVLTAVNYTAAHQAQPPLVRDALRIWNGIPPTAEGLQRALPSHLRAGGMAALGLAAAWFAGAAPAAWFGTGVPPLRLVLGVGLGSLAIFATGLAGLWLP